MESGPSAVRKQVLKTLEDLGTDYLDMYCIHWPVPEGVHVMAYKELEKLKEEGLIRHLGVSNYAIEDYKELMEAGCR
jgi:diketogulonate reductase-like aldo/keto reductase